MSNNVTFSAGSKLESVIIEGPEALQKYIDSGEIEELHDVMPIKDDDEDYLNDFDSNDESHATTTGVTTIHPPVATDSDMRNMDQDMRNFNFPLDSNMHGDSDYRSNVNRDLNFQPPPHDYDMRNEMGDEDFREFNRDQDYRHYDESEEGYEDYYEDSRGGSWRSNGDYNNRDYNNRGQNNFGGNQNFRSQSGGFNNSREFSNKNDNWNSHNSGDSFRSRGPKRGSGPRGGLRSRRPRGSSRGGGGGRGGGNLGRGQSSSRGRF